MHTTKVLPTGSFIHRFISFPQFFSHQPRGGGAALDKWQHDMFAVNNFGGAQMVTRSGAASQVAKLLISNLDYGVSDDDLRVS